MAPLCPFQGPDIEDEVQMGVIPRRRQIWIFPLRGVLVGFMLGWFGLFLTALTMSLPQHGRCPSLPRRCLNFATTEAADYIEFVVKVAIVEIYNERLPVMDFYGHVTMCMFFVMAMSWKKNLILSGFFQAFVIFLIQRRTT